MKVKGKVTSGSGEGAFYVNKYVTYFENALGFTCHPGTLNVKVNDLPDFSKYLKIEVKPSEENLMQVDCYLININDAYDGAIVIPHKTVHDKDTIEIIAAVDLRDRLQLNDGDEFECELV